MLKLVVNNGRPNYEELHEKERWLRDVEFLRELAATELMAANLEDEDVVRIEVVEGQAKIVEPSP